MTTAKNPTPKAAPEGISDDTILKVAKEIVVKFIEIGQLSPAKFAETFGEVYRAVRDTVRS